MEQVPVVVTHRGSVSPIEKLGTRKEETYEWMIGTKVDTRLVIIIYEKRWTPSLEL